MRSYFYLSFFAFLILAQAHAATFLLLEPSFGKRANGLQISYFSMNAQPGFNLMGGAEVSYLNATNPDKDLEGSLFMISPGISLRYLTPIWLMPELDLALNVGYESYTENCDGSACPESSGWVLGGTLRQKMLLVPSFRFSPIIGAGLFETYNFSSKLYPYDLGVTLIAGVRF